MCTTIGQLSQPRWYPYLGQKWFCALNTVSHSIGTCSGTRLCRHLAVVRTPSCTSCPISNDTALGQFLALFSFWCRHPGGRVKRTPMHTYGWPRSSNRCFKYHIPNSLPVCFQRYFFAVFKMISFNVCLVPIQPLWALEMTRPHPLEVSIPPGIGWHVFPWEEGILCSVQWKSWR